MSAVDSIVFYIYLWLTYKTCYLMIAKILLVCPERCALLYILQPFSSQGDGDIEAISYCDSRTK